MHQLLSRAAIDGYSVVSHVNHMAYTWLVWQNSEIHASPRKTLDVYQTNSLLKGGVWEWDQVHAGWWCKSYIQCCGRRQGNLAVSQEFIILYIYNIIHIHVHVQLHCWPRKPVMIVTGIFCLLVVVAVGEGWAGGIGTRSGQSSSESIYGGLLLEINKVQSASVVGVI